VRGAKSLMLYTRFHSEGLQEFEIQVDDEPVILVPSKAVLRIKIEDIIARL
jgi:hypothetical protein